MKKLPDDCVFEICGYLPIRECLNVYKYLGDSYPIDYKIQRRINEGNNVMCELKKCFEIFTKCKDVIKLLRLRRMSNLTNALNMIENEPGKVSLKSVKLYRKLNKMTIFYQCKICNIMVNNYCIKTATGFNICRLCYNVISYDPNVIKMTKNEYIDMKYFDEMLKYFNIKK